MDFLGAVNRVLVNAFILKGDDDLITNFNSNQHEATIRVAKNAIQTELNGILSFFPIDYEKTSTPGSITTVVGQRSYALPADFIRFWESNPYLYLSTDASRRCYEWSGGEGQLRRDQVLYLTDQGEENWWYWDATTSKKVALFQVPNGIRTWYFDYEKDVTITNSTDLLPFHNEAEAQSFADMASRRFTYMTEAGRDLAQLDQDGQYISSFGTLMNFMRHRNPSNHYGKSYR